MKEEKKSVAKTIGVVAAGAAVVGLATYLVLPPVAPPKRITLMWDHEAPESVIFEIVSKTNIQAPWIFRTNVVGTNAVTLPANQAQEFFTISKVMDRGDTNISIRQKGF